MKFLVVLFSIIALMLASVRAKSKTHCYEPPYDGRCIEKVLKFFYNADTETCDQYINGGCYGNNNIFDTKEDCEGLCVPSKRKFNLIHCYLPKDDGGCKALFSRFFYNAETNTCEEFRYGGCSGNNNRFDTKEECERLCYKQKQFAFPIDIRSILKRGFKHSRI